MKDRVYMSSARACALAVWSVLGVGCPGGDGDAPADVDRLVVTTLVDVEADDGEVSLREAVAYAQEVAGQQTVRFEEGLTGEITLDSAFKVQGDASNALVVEGGQAITLVAASGQRVWELEGPSLTLKGLTHRGSAVADSEGGGCIRARSGALVVEGGKISGCEASGGASLTTGGGAVRAFKDVPVTLKGVDLEGNKSNRHGGALYVEGALVMEGVNLTDNTALGSGGGVYQVGALTSAQDCAFVRNSADSGAGLMVEPPSAEQAQVTLGSAQFEANQASFMAGGFYMKGAGDVVMTGAIFKENSSAGRAGGLAAVGSGRLELDQARFERNRAAMSESGGAVFGDGPALESAGSVFEGNAADQGGAVYWRGLIKVSGGEVKDNVAESNGGGLWLESPGMLALDGVKITGKRAGARGGGVALGVTGGGSASIQGGQITQNTASAGGGGLTTSASLALSAVEIRENTAEFGGGVETSAGTTLTVGAGAQITANQATSASASEQNKVGGGVSNDGDVVVSGGSVSGNMPDDFSAPDRVSGQ